jgi:hypothetical protein
MHRLSALLVLLFCLPAVPVAVGGEVEVESIRIRSEWRGFGEPQDDSLTVTREGGRFVARGRTVDADKVARLARALSAPPVEALDTASLGIDRAWLERNARAALAAAYQSPMGEPVAEQLALFVRLFTDPAVVGQSVERALGGGGIDDYPEIEVEVRWTDGRSTVVRSSSNRLFMVPLRVETGGEGFGTYDAEIARAIAELLPAQFANRERLAGEGLAKRLAEAVIDANAREWSQVELKAHFGDAVAPLAQRFTVAKSSIGYLTSFDVGGANSSATLAWNATLVDARLPSSFVVGVSIPITDKKLASLDPFLTRIDAIEARVLAVRWLRKYVDEHTSVRVEIRFVTDRSLSAKAAGAVIAELERTGRGARADRIAASLGDAILLEVYERTSLSRWIVLADGGLLLWHFEGRAPLGRDKASVDAWECGGFYCSGVVFGPDGTPSNAYR